MKSVRSNRSKKRVGVERLCLILVIALYPSALFMKLYKNVPSSSKFAIGDEGALTLNGHFR
jgi:hypothetical protein